MKDQMLFELAKKLEDVSFDTDSVNIGILPNEDVHKLVKQSRAIHELINYIAELKRGG